MDNNYIMFTKGAFDVLLDRAKYIRTSDGVKELTQDDKDKILNQTILIRKWS